MPAETAFAAPRNPAGHAPIRRSGSIRRTSTLETSWPEGMAGNLHITGRARDAVTPRSGGPPTVCAYDTFQAELRWDRTIVAIAAAPARDAIGRLVGARGGGHLRSALDEILPQERRNATPLHLILDDISGASLVAGWAWSLWSDGWQGARAGAGSPAGGPTFTRSSMEGVCTGFRPGSSALADDDASRASHNATPVKDLRHPDDPDGWHPFSEQAGVGMRRARLIDVWCDEVIHIDALFQDSATHPTGGRAAIHEYGLKATADPRSLELLSLVADPRVLPFPECPSATANIVRMLGAPLPALRDKVLVELKGVAGCTHLNDMLRSLAEAAVLVERLNRSLPA